VKWKFNKKDKVIGKKHNELLSLIAPLHVILVGKKEMFPLIAHGRTRSKKW
jgi:hypothetical protein